MNVSEIVVSMFAILHFSAILFFFRAFNLIELLNIYILGPGLYFAFLCSFGWVLEFASQFPYIKESYIFSAKTKKNDDDDNNIGKHKTSIVSAI